ncbi:MAG: precorrin-3B C(17)-methyltransferase [Desulfuromonas sp.]|nr:precorrin-3B C(17)-methyltransferase [Desulfuromonas sp.]
MYLVGIGPGSQQDRTPRASQAILDSDVVVGYGPYVASIADLITEQQTVTSGMMKEAERCRAAIDAAKNGKVVSLISSGDAGMYGMAGLAMEMAAAEGDSIEMEVIPGVTAANSAAALMGAPLMLDSATISLSDLLVPWEMIIQRLEAVAAADMVVSLYNPRSKKRIKQLDEAVRIFRTQRPGTTPVGIATAVGAEDEQLVITDLDHIFDHQIGMRSMVIIGNASTCIVDGRMVTPRGYYK